MEHKVIAYFDGFNYYEGLRKKSWRNYYWQDFVKFVEFFLKPYQSLEAVRYFSAIQKNAEKAKRQDKLFQANKLNPRFSLILGEFRPRIKWRDIECNGRKVGKQIRFWEEKKSDVALASYMIRDVVLGKCDTIFLFSADSDLTPALDIIQEIAGHNKPIKIIVFFPPGNYSHDLFNKANKVMHLENHEYKFKASQLPEQLTLPGGFNLDRPAKWC
ncbi:MAG: NYN domain-containing protein [Clostridiaceae bacterium]|nr:NYN domain-containing protein [Clostridiaceae bacterium]